MKNKGLLKPTIQVTFFSIISILVSFANQLAVAYYFGASSQRDAYFAAMVIPNYLSAIFVGSICMIFLPRYIDILQNEGEQKSHEFFGNTLFFSFLLTLFVVILFSFFAKLILSFTAPGFDSINQHLTKKLLVILLPTVIFQIIASLFSSILQVNHKFLIPAIAPIIGALISLIIVLIFSTRLGIISLAIGTLISSVIILIITILSLDRPTLKRKFKFNIKDPNLKSFILVVLPLFFGGVIYRLMPVFERMIASTLPQGSISYLGYANQFLVIFATIITSGIATTYFPKMSRAYSENDIESLRTTFLSVFTIILILVIPIAVVFYVFGIQIVHVLFERGAFTDDITIAVYSTFVILLGALIFQSLGNIVMRVLYLSNKTLWATSIAFVEIATYLFVGMWLCNYFSYKGLAIAQSLSTGLTMIFSVLLINYSLFKLGSIFLKSFLKILFSNLVFFIFLTFINVVWIDFDNIAFIILKTCVGFIILFYTLLILKVEEIINIKNMVGIKIKKLLT